MAGVSAAASAYEAVLFDFGGIFIDSPFLGFEAHGRELNVDSRRLIELTFGKLDEDTGHPWHRVERGELGMVEARLEIISLYREAGIDADPFELLARSLGSHQEARPAVLDCVRSLRGAGLKIALLTNNALEGRERWRALLPIDELFDDVIDSSEVGMRKPNPAIYELTLERLGGVAPGASIFLDDLPENVEAAARLGIRGILMGPDPEPALKELFFAVESGSRGLVNPGHGEV